MSFSAHCGTAAHGLPIPLWPSLETLDALRDRDVLDGEVGEWMVRGITTRNYEGTLTCLSDGLGLKKSAVSSAFRRA